MNHTGSTQTDMMSVALYNYDKLSNGLNYYNRHNRYAGCRHNSNDDDDDDDGGGAGGGGGDHEVCVKACYEQL